MGVAGGIAASAGRGAGWPLLVLFGACGLLIGFVVAKCLGAVAYACLDRACRDHASTTVLVIWDIGYVIVSLAMPVTSGVIAILIPSATLPSLA